MIVINLIPASDYRRESYGILLESETVHYFTGPGIHNPSHAHRLDVWENRERDGVLVDPHNKPTTDRYSFLFPALASALASVISAHPGKPDKRGEALKLGDVVELRIHGYAIGRLTIGADRWHDPHGTLTGRDELRALVADWRDGAEHFLAEQDENVYDPQGEVNAATGQAMADCADQLSRILDTMEA